MERGGGGRGRSGEGGSSCRGRRGARWLPAAPRPAAPGDAPDSQWLRRGVQQMASDCAVPSSSSSSSSSSSFSAEVARRWNGWSPDTHHHLSCAREAQGSAAPRGCGGGSGEAGECARAAPRAGDAQPLAGAGESWQRPGLGGGVRRGQTLLSAPWAASFTPSPGQTWELASGASPTPLRGGCKVRRARALADGDTPSGDLGRDLRRRDQAMRLGHEEPCSRTSSLLWGLLMKGTRGPSSCAGSLGAQDWRAGSSAGFANRLTEGSLSVVLTVKSARGRSLPLEDS